MEEFVVVLLQFLIETIVEFLFYAPWFVGSRTAPPSMDSWAPWKKGLSCCTAGAVLAGLSLLVWRRVIIPIGTLRLVNLIVAPIASGAMYRAFAASRAKRGASIVPREQFWQAFWFTLGWAAVRFAFATRP